MQDYITPCLINSFHSIKHSAPWYSPNCLSLSVIFLLLLFFSKKCIGMLIPSLWVWRGHCASRCEWRKRHSEIRFFTVKATGLRRICSNPIGIAIQTISRCQTLSEINPDTIWVCQKTDLAWPSEQGHRVLSTASTLLLLTSKYLPRPNFQPQRAGDLTSVRPPGERRHRVVVAQAGEKERGAPTFQKLRGALKLFGLYRSSWKTYEKLQQPMCKIGQ